MFSPRIARRSLQRYRRKGLGKLERQMLAGPSWRPDDALVLEIGGGIGAMLAEPGGRMKRGRSSSSSPPTAVRAGACRENEARVGFRVEDVSSGLTRSSRVMSSS
jgi:hypothetical protein